MISSCLSISTFPSGDVGEGEMRVNLHLDNIGEEFPGKIARKGFSNNDSKDLGILARWRERVAIISIARHLNQDIDNQKG